MAEVCWHPAGTECHHAHWNTLFFGIKSTYDLRALAKQSTSDITAVDKQAKDLKAEGDTVAKQYEELQGKLPGLLQIEHQVSDLTAKVTRIETELPARVYI